jgi:hypothetical protein
MRSIKKPVLIHGKNKYRLLFIFIPTCGEATLITHGGQYMKYNLKESNANERPPHSVCNLSATR